MSGGRLSGLLSVLGGRVGATLLSACITPLIVRILGSNDYGRYAFVLSMFAVITIFVRAGISAGIRKYLAEDRSVGGWVEGVFAFYARLAVGLALLGGGCLILFGLYGPVDRLLGEGFSVYLFLLAGMVFTDQLFYVSRYTLMGLKLERYSETLTVVQKALLGVFGLTLAYVGFDVVGVLAGTALASLVCATLAFGRLRKRIDLSTVFRPLPSQLPIRQFLGFNLFNTVFILLTISLYNVDILLLQPLVGSRQTGLYKSALVVAEFVWIVPQAVQIIFIQSSSELWAEGNHEEITEMASRATRYTFLLTALMLLGLAALASEFVGVYFGPGFGGAVEPLLLLLPGVLGFAIARPIYAIGQGKGSFRLLIAATGSAAVLNLALNLALIPRYGMTGAAVSTSIGYATMVVFHGVAARRIGYDPFVDLRVARVVTTAALTAPVVFGLARVIRSPILSLVVVPPVGFAVYSVLAIRLGAVTREELLPFVRSLPSPTADVLAGLLHRV